MPYLSQIIDASIFFFFCYYPFFSVSIELSRYFGLSAQYFSLKCSSIDKIPNYQIFHACIAGISSYITVLTSFLLPSPVSGVRHLQQAYMYVPLEIPVS